MSDRDDELSVDELEGAAGGALSDNTNCSGGCTSNSNCSGGCGPTPILAAE